VEVRQTGQVKCVAEYRANRTGTLPRRALQTGRPEHTGRIWPNARAWKYRITFPPSLVSKVPHPFDDDLLHIVTDREESRLERLTEFGVHCPGILHQRPGLGVYVLKPECRHGGAACTGYDHKGHQCAVPAFNLGRRGHLKNDAVNFFKRWRAGRPVRFRYAYGDAGGAEVVPKLKDAL
jgi:hypothetical protein